MVYFTDKLKPARNTPVKQLPEKQRKVFATKTYFAL